MNPCIEYVIKCTGSLNINKKVGENHNILKLAVNDTEIHPFVMIISGQLQCLMMEVLETHSVVARGCIYGCRDYWRTDGWDRLQTG